MHPISTTILQKHMVRKTKDQKQAFRAYLVEALVGEGIEVRLESQKGFLPMTNIVIGSPAQARILIGAHYDTPALMPLPYIMPRNFLLMLLSQLLLVALPLAAGLLLGGLAGRLSDIPSLPITVFMAVWLLFLAALVLGPPNKHNANDNSSGVLGVVETLLALRPEEREKVCFVLFDHEESGLVGSSQFYAAHRREIGLTPLVNLDCIGDGEAIILVVSSKVRKDAQLYPAIRAAFDAQVAARSKTLLYDTPLSTFYPSDQFSFPSSVAIAAMRKSPLIGYYLADIHSPRDQRLDEVNLALISGALADLVRGLD